MRNKAILIFLFNIILLLSCKKEKQEIPQPGEIKQEEKNFYKDLKLDSLQQLSVVVSFQINKPVKTVGILTALDSTSLVDRIASYMERDLTFKDNRYSVKIEWPYNLPPFDDTFWFRLYVTNDNGTRTYSQVFRQPIASYQIKNTYIVNGNGSFNKHPKDFYMNYEGGVLGTYDNALILEAVTTDVNPSNYRAMLNEVSIVTNKVDPMVHPASHKQVVFDVPDNFPLGPAVFKCYYLNKLIYTSQVTVINGGLLTKDTWQQAPLYSWRSIFVHNNELYAFNTGLTPIENQFYKWNLSTKNWTQLPNPSSAPKIGNTDKAFSIDGIVYFSPSYIRQSNIFVQNSPYNYKEVITTYQPSNNTWKEIELFDTKDINLDKGVETVETFLIGEDIYCIVRETPKATNALRTVLKVFNVRDKSWKEQMQLPNKLYKATILNGQVYVLSTEYDVQQGATSSYKNEFLILDPNSKTLTKKSWINYKNTGTYKPYLVSFENKIYVYGGQYSSGYSSLYSSLFGVYDPGSDSWSPVSGYSYFTGWTSQTDGFMLPINNKLYLGFGLNRYTNGHINGSVKNLSISQVSIK